MTRLSPSRGSWQRLRGDDLFKFIRGVAYKKDEARAERFPGSVGVLRAGNIQDGRIVLDDLVYVPEAKVSESQRVRVGDVVLAMSSGSASVVGKAATVDREYEDLAFGAFCGLLRPIDPKLARLPSYYFQSRDYRQRISALAAGVNINNLKWDHLAGLEFEVPPPDAQRRIVAKIEELTGHSRCARAALEAVPPLLAKLRQSVLAAAFSGRLTAAWRAAHPDVEPASVLLERIRAERRRRWEEAELAKMRARGKEPGDDGWKGRYREPVAVDATGLPGLPEGWCWVSGDELAWETTVGHVGPMKARYQPIGIPFLRSQNVRENHVDTEGLVFIPEDFHSSLPNSQLQPGDLVVVRSGAPGTAAVIPASLADANCADLVVSRIVPPLSADLVARFMNSTFARQEVLSRQVGVAQQHFNVREMKAFPIPLIGLAEAEVISAVLDGVLHSVADIERLVADVERRGGEADRSILAAAFRGHLQWVNHPDRTDAVAPVPRAGSS